MSRPGLPLLLLVSLPAVFWLGACGGTRAPDAPPTGRLDLPPARAFFADPPLEHVRLSPDGRRLVGITSRRGQRALIVRDVRGGRIRYLGRFDSRERRFRTLGWSGERRIVFGIERPRPLGGPETSIVEISTFELARWRPPRDGAIWPLPVSPSGRDAPVVHWLPNDPERILASWFDAGSEAVRVRRIAVRTGTGEDASPEVDGALEWHADASGGVRAVTVEDREALALRLHARTDPGRPFRALVDADYESETSLAFAGFSADPGRIYVYATTDAGRRGVFEYDLWAHSRGALVAADPVYDAGPLHYGAGDRLLAVEIEGLRPALRFVDEDFERQQVAIDAALFGTINRVLGAGEEIALVERSGDTTPPTWYVYDRSAHELRYLYTAHPELEGVALAEMRPVRFSARDGLEIDGYLTLPPGASPRGLPVIVIPHDGPTARDGWGWDPRVQFLASRGFAVLQPNFRGSSGYGQEFERRGYAAWGRAMQEDIVDAAAWLVSEGIADPDRVGLYGAGYGGYAALMGPIVAPGVFRAVASWGGISDLVDLLDRPERHDAGDPNAPLVWARRPEELAQISPRHNAERIDVPVLLGHGTADRVVHVSQTKAMAAALEATGAEVELHVLREEDHDFRIERYRIEFHRALADFFERNLRRRGAARE